MPKPADQTDCPFCTTAMETPGTLLAVMKAETAFSIWPRFAGERVLSFSAARAQEMTTSKAASTRENGSRAREGWKFGGTCADLRSESLAQNGCGMRRCQAGVRPRRHGE